MYLIRQMQTTDNKATVKSVQWQDSKAQHTLTTARCCTPKQCRFFETHCMAVLFALSNPSFPS